MEDTQKWLVIVVQPDSSFLGFPCPSADFMPAENVAPMASLVPPTVVRNISVIAHTALVTGQRKPLAIAQ
jgi:hypothetical protein